MSNEFFPVGIRQNWCRLLPQTQLGEHTTLPDPVAGFKGADSWKEGTEVEDGEGLDGRVEGNEGAIDGGK